MGKFRDLKVWQRAHALTLGVYTATASFPSAETYGLTSQIRRACASIPANIAEGCGRSGDAELTRFLHIAAGSATELEYHLLLARDLHYLDTPTHDRLHTHLNEVQRMLASLIRTLPPPSRAANQPSPHPATKD